LYKRLFQGSHF